MADILAALPREYRDDPWVQAILGAIADKVLGQEASAQDTAAQILLDTLTWNLATEETIAGITPKSGATLADRLSVLSAKWRSGGKIDIAQIQAVADAWKNGEVAVSYPDNRLHLQFVGQFGVPDDMDGLLAAVGEVSPAHIPIDYTLRYLLVRDVAAMTIDTLQAQTIDNFAFGGDT